MCFPKQGSPDMKSMADRGTAVLLWPRGQVSVAHVLYGTRLSNTLRGDWDSPSKRTWDVSILCSPFIKQLIL